MLLLLVFAEHLSNVRWKLRSRRSFGNSHRSIRKLSFSHRPTDKTNTIQLNQDPSSFQRKRTLNELQMLIMFFLSICRLHLSIDSNIAMWAEAHESLLQTFNSPVSQLLLCPEWLWCHYKCHSNLMLENSHKHHSILAIFFLYDMVIKPRIFLLHISGSVYYWFHFIYITCSV